MSARLQFEVTTQPDFDGFKFYVEAGRPFDPELYEEAYGVRVASADVERVQAVAAKLVHGEWLEVSHEVNS